MICTKRASERIVGSIPRQVLDRFRASQATHPPRAGLFPSTCPAEALTKEEAAPFRIFTAY